MSFEQRVALMKPLNATEIEILQEFADGLGTAEISGQPQNYSPGNQELHVSGVPETWRR